MAFADWENTGTATFQWDSLSPIQGSHSWVAVGAGTNLFASGLIAGVTNKCGRIRVLHKRLDTAAPGDHPVLPKFFIYGMMQSSFGVSSNAYVCGYDGGSANTLTLYKTSLTNANASLGNLATGPNPGAAALQGFVYAMQLNWQTDPISGNVLLTGSFDGPISSPDTYDYSTLVDCVSYTDGSTPYTVGVTAGWAGNTSGATRKEYYDWVDIFTD